MRAHVAHVSTVHPSSDTRIFVKECRSLAGAGYEVSLVATHSKRETRDRIQIVPLKRRLSRAERMTWGSLGALRETILCGASVCHLHDPELIPAGLLLKALGRTVVYDVHEDLPRQIGVKHWLPTGTHRAVAVFAELLEGLAVRCFDAVVTATPQIARRFAGRNPNTVVIRNFPLETEFVTVSAWDSRQPHACYVGAITRERGIEDLVEAFDGMGAELHLAGTFYPGDLQAHLAGRPGWDKVVYRGQLDRAGVTEMMNSCKVGIVCLRPTPNYVDSLPVKMFEYMAAGLPVVATDYPVWREIVEGAGAGILVPPCDAGAIREAVQYLLSHDDEARRMGEAGRRAVEIRYNWCSEEAALLDLYRLLTA